MRKAPDGSQAGWGGSSFTHNALLLCSVVAVGGWCLEFELDSQSVGSQGDGCPWPVLPRGGDG